MADPTTPPAPTSPDPCLDPVILAEGLNHWFGQGETRTPAVVDLTVEIGRGEIVILTGPSGSGKTTLLTLVGALRRVQQGTLRVLGRDLSRLDQAGLVRHRGDVGFVFQQHNLFSSLSAVENVRMATAMKPAPVSEMNRRASAVLERIGMG
ncbi:MAG: ATP-binding cassette domain-containing protein, partial [Planctomycetia bacterium]|nr:ATP-binding cassette domain-containing protein [Planctomycetia bacterium]